MGTYNTTNLTQPDFTIPYYNKGLTHVSDNENIISRDINGNILIQSESANSNLLIIEPIVNEVTTVSALKVLDTSFQYYKFPVSVKTSNTIIDFDIDNVENIVNTELTLPISVDSRNQISDLDRIGTYASSDWYYGDGSTITSGYKTLPFTGGNQSRANSYTITQEVLDILRVKNKTLKFSVQLQFTGLLSSRTPYRVRLNRLNPKSYRSFKTIVLYSEGNVGQPGTNDNPNSFSWTAPGPSHQYPYFYMEYYVDMNDIVVGDSYYIEAVANGSSWSLNTNGYWTIEAVDIPSINGYYGYKSNSFKQAGVYNISPDTAIINDTALLDITGKLVPIEIIGIKNETSNQKFVYK